jgi:hypothetical protein
MLLVIGSDENYGSEASIVKKKDITDVDMFRLVSLFNTFSTDLKALFW